MTPYYEQDGIAIYHGDCREILPHLPGLPGDCIVADPPYGVGKNYGDLSFDDLATFQWAVALVADSGLPASVHLSVSRLYDLPRRPQWTGVWNKPLGMSGLIAYPIYPHWEPIAFYNIQGDFSGNKGHRSDVFTFSPENASVSGHPSPKPESLAAELIRFFNRETVLDPFMGTGTTLVAAKNLGRKAIGIEIEEKYCEIAAKRLAQTIMKFPEGEAQ
jgi:site-specific DNA-methyltransferase (adenine-specific)